MDEPENSSGFRDVLQFLLRVAVAVIVLCCIAELAALVGLVDYRTLIGPNHAWKFRSVADPELGSIRRPYTHKKGSAVGGNDAAAFNTPKSDLTLFQWDVKYDHNGFRNGSDLQRADIVMVGDSMVEGMTVTDSELLTSQLAQLQGKVVANLGQGGYGPLEEIVVFKRYALPLHARTIFWMFCEANDLQDVLAYHRAIDHPQDFLHAFWTRSFTRNAGLTIQRLLSPPVKPPGEKHSGLCPQPDGKPVTVYFGYPAGALSAEELSAVVATVHALATAYQLSAAQGTRLVFVFVPSKYRVLHSLCQFPEDSVCRDWVLPDTSQRLQSGLRSVSPDIGYLDLTPYLVEAAKTQGLPYYRDDEHWSPEGHRVVAQVINQYLAATGSP
jgi:SGNH hydrolase-like domain, acetyltransferase AlgX